MSKEFETKVLDFIEFSQKNFINLNNKISGLEVKMDEKIDNLEAKMDNKLSDLEVKMDEKIDNLEVKMNNKITNLEAKMDNKISDLEVKMNETISNLDEKFTSLYENLNRSLTLIENKVMTEFPALFEAFELHQEMHKDYDEKNSYLSAKVEEDSMRISVLEDQIKFLKNN